MRRLCFGTGRGLGIHRGRMHPLAVHREYEEQRLNDSKPRARWPEEHVMLLAVAEAKFADGIVAVNDFLFNALGERHRSYSSPVLSVSKDTRSSNALGTWIPLSLNWLIALSGVVLLKGPGKV